MGKRKLLIENYYKFLKTHPKYFKSPCLVLDRYGFTVVCSELKYKIGGKPQKYLTDIIKCRAIEKGHIVYRWTTAAYGEPLFEVWHNEKILDKYGDEFTPKGASQ